MSVQNLTCKTLNLCKDWFLFGYLLIYFVLVTETTNSLSVVSVSFQEK